MQIIIILDGLTGWSDNYSAGINCYSIASATDNYGSAGPLGANCLYGNWYTRFENSFWSEETSGLTNAYSGTKVTESELRNQSTYTNAGWDFNTIWYMDPLTGYPKLQWENNK